MFSFGKFVTPQTNQHEAHLSAEPDTDYFLRWFKISWQVYQKLTPGWKQNTYTFKECPWKKMLDMILENISGCKMNLTLKSAFKIFCCKSQKCQHWGAGSSSIKISALIPGRKEKPKWRTKPSSSAQCVSESSGALARSHVQKVRVPTKDGERVQVCCEFPGLASQEIKKPNGGMKEGRREREGGRQGSKNYRSLCSWTSGSSETNRNAKLERANDVNERGVSCLQTQGVEPVHSRDKFWCLGRISLPS